MIFYLWGEDNFRSKQKLNELKEKFLREVDSTGFNLAILEGGEITLDIFRQSVLSAPFMTRRRMVVISGLLNQKLKPELENEITHYLNRATNTPEEPLLIFYESENGKNSKKRTSAVKAKTNSISELLLQKSDYTQEFTFFKKPELKQWIKNELKVRSDSGVAKFLGDHFIDILLACGSHNLWKISTIIDQLIAYHHNNPSFDKDEAQNLINIEAVEHNIWQLIDAILGKDHVLALKLVEEQQVKSSYALFLSEFSKQIKLLLEIKADESIVYQKIDRPRFIMLKALKFSHNFTKAQLESIHNQLLQLDRDYKKGSVDFRSWLSLFIAKLEII